MSTPDIIFENDELIAVNKPAGLIVHSDGRTREPSLAQWLLEKYPELGSVGEPWISPQGERVLIAGIAHRLDRTTSGVILVAKTNAMYAYLKNEFKARRVQKVYRAFVYGHMQGEGKIIAEIMRTSEPPRRWHARPCDESDKRAAITEWSVLQNIGEATYLELRPKTGRTHQLRVHLASIGHPIVADRLYALDRESTLGFNRPALHAHSVFLMLLGKSETFTALLPDDFDTAIKEARR